MQVSKTEENVKKGPEGTGPLDLSLRKSMDDDVIVDTAEDEKENRGSADNIFPSPDHEDIICAPSIPLMLSTSSTCSSPSPAPPSPSSSTSPHSVVVKKTSSISDIKKQRNELNSNSPSPKSSPSAGQKSPRRTPNGFITNSGKQLKNEDRKKADLVLHPKLEANSNNLNLSNLLLAAAAQNQQLDSIQQAELQQAMPFPAELIPHIAAAARVVPGKQGKPLASLQGILPGAANIPLLLPQLTGNSRAATPDLLNPASILPLYSDMALRLVAGAVNPELQTPPPQVLVKQGVSKCQECNIVFCKHENYIAHKKHYCSARQAVSESVPVQEETLGHKSVSPAVPNSPPTSTSPPPPPVPVKERSTGNSLPNPTIASSSSGRLYQFICAACGIKFTSYDNLTAHQTHYCPKRPALEPEKSSRKCSKCKVSKKISYC